MHTYILRSNYNNQV